MPNCDFYATRNDFKIILDFIFSECDIRIFQNYSEYEKPLKEFKDISDFISYFQIADWSIPIRKTIYLQLFVNNSGKLRINKINLDPKHCNGANYRYVVQGWGLIQLYLESEIESGLRTSHTNHNSKERAQKWESTYYDKLGAIKDWNFELVNQVSRKINSYIKKISVDKIKSRYILANAKLQNEKGLIFL